MESAVRDMEKVGQRLGTFRKISYFCPQKHRGHGSMCTYYIDVHRNRVKTISEELFAYLLDDEERYRQMTELVERNVSQEQTDEDDEDDIENEQMEVDEEETSIKISRLLRQQRDCHQLERYPRGSLRLARQRDEVTNTLIPAWLRSLTGIYHDPQV